MITPVPTPTLERQMTEFIAWQVMQHLENERMLVADPSTSAHSSGDPSTSRLHGAASGQALGRQDAPALYAWMLPDRVALILDPLQVKRIQLMSSQRFLHELGTILQGRRIVPTNHRCLIFQVSYFPQEPEHALASKPLDLSRQPSPLHVPIGATAKRDLWLSLVELDAVLIGGARRMGKTNLLHGWIAALLKGGETRLVLFDGKGGAEFARYQNAADLDDRALVQIVEGKLAPVLGELFAEMNARLAELRAAGVTNLDAYNARVRPDATRRMRRIVLIVDELAYALQEPGVEGVLVDLAARGGAVGIHPVVATNQCRAEVVSANLKVNLHTRIALAVPTQSDSRVILDASNAARLPNIKGRLLLRWDARLIQAQVFRVDLPDMNEVGTPLPPMLSERECQIAHAAVENGGEFKIREIANAVKERIEDVTRLAQEWQAKGYLTEVQRGRNGNGGRRVTAALMAILEQAECAECGNVRNVAECG